jgi:polyisoprenyl-teichoic acid--peptidoglycan teichoic acid transferase
MPEGSSGSGGGSSGDRGTSSGGGDKGASGAGKPGTPKRATSKEAGSGKSPESKKPAAAKKPDEHLADIDPDAEIDEAVRGVDDDAPAGEEPAGDGEHDQEDLEEDSELERLISAETQEWEAAEAVEEPSAPRGADDGSGDGREAEEPTLAAAAGEGLGQARERASAVGHWRPRFPMWARFASASFLIVVSMATATAASLILYLGDIAQALRNTEAFRGVDKFLTQVDGGSPQTILILGSDKRPEDKKIKFKGLSDTTMLLRLDPDRNAIALFSLPRDLKVSIPGYGIDKLNAAYGYGGPQLTLQTVQELTNLQINHLVNVDFEGFARAVNAIDCVYVDIDRRYFHSNVNTAAAADYEEIDLQPGYQALCGFDALDYARYRHTDNDIVRAARQQDFLREARAKVPPDKLIGDRKELISIFTEHTSSDINDPQTMLQVLKLFLDARDAPLKAVHFEGTLGPSYVTATPQQIQKAVNAFLGIQATGQEGQTAAPDAPVAPEAAPDQTPVTPAAPSDNKATSEPRAIAPSGQPVDNHYDVTHTEYGKELAQTVRARVAKLPIYYPTVLESGSDFAQKPRVYKINGTGEGSPPPAQRAAYKWVFARPAIGEYYGFMATRWKDPPNLEDPDDTRTVGDREYDIYYEGDRVRMIAWQTDQGSFWVSNTLIESLSAREMLKVADGMKELPRLAPAPGPAATG